MKLNKTKKIKSDIVKEISEKTGIFQQDVKLIVNAFIESIRNNLLANHKIEIRNLGTFHTRVHRPKKIVDVNTGEKRVIGFRKKPKLKFGYDFSKMIEDNYTLDEIEDL